MAGEYTLDVLVNPIENRAAASAMGQRMGAAFNDGWNKGQSKQPLGRITSDVSQFQKSIEASNARVIAFGASAGSIYLVQAAFRKLLSDAVIVQKSLTDINVILGLGSTAMKAFSNEMFKAASQTGQTFETAGKVALEFARHGVSASETAKRMTSAMQLMRISGLDATDAVNSITAAINAFSKEGITSADIVNRLTAVDTKFAVSAQDLAKAVQRVGATAEDAGVRFNQLLGFVAAAQTVTARGGAVIGNAFKSIFTRLARPQVLDDLESIGVTTKTASGQILPMVTILKNLASQYDHLSYSQKSFVSEAVGGVYQVNILKASLADLGNGLSIFDKATMAAEQSTGLIDKRMAMLNETIATKLNTSVLEITKLFANFSTISFGDSAKSGLDRMNEVMASYSKLLEDIVPDDSVGTKIGKTLAVGIVKGLGDIISGPGIQLAVALLTKSFGTLGGFAIKAGKEFLGANSQAEAMAAIQKSIGAFIHSNEEAQKLFNNQLLTSTQLAQKLADLYLPVMASQNLAHKKQTNVEKEAATIAAKSMSATIPGIAAGYIPDFASEEAEARSLGALNPKAEWGKGTIGGKKFIKNDQEIEIPGFGRNGDSAVIPMYADGFVPNFSTRLKASDSSLAGMLLRYDDRGKGQEVADLSRLISTTSNHNGGKTQYSKHFEKHASDYFNQNILQRYPGTQVHRSIPTHTLPHGDSFEGYDSLHEITTYNEELAGKLRIPLGVKSMIGLQAKGGQIDRERVTDIETAMALGDEHIRQLMQMMPEKGLRVPETRIVGYSTTSIPTGTMFRTNLAAGNVSLSFKKMFDKQFGTTHLFGMNGNEKVGEIEYSGNSKMKEIEGFEIGDKYRGKGLAKQFYQALGKGFVKGTLLPNTDSEGNTFFPQLSRAGVSKGGYVHQWNDSDVGTTKLSINDFKRLISEKRGDKQFWDDNSFNLYTHHAAGFMPNFASQNTMNSVFIAASKMPNSANIIEKLKEGAGLSDESFLKAAKILGVNMGGGGGNTGSLFDNIHAAFNSKGSDDWWKNVDAKFKARDEKFGYPITDNEQKNINFVQGLFKRKFSSFSNIKDMMDHREYSGEQDNKTGAFGTGLDFNSGHDEFIKKFKDKYLRKKAEFSSRKEPTLRFGLFGAEFGLDDDFKDFEMSDSRQSSLERFFAKRLNKYSSRGRFSNGFIPNFSALGDAVKREMAAGYSSSQIRVGQNPSLVSSSNPRGLGVYNSTEGSLSNGISLAQSAGINPKTKGMAAGFVPNFDMGNIGMSMMLGIFQGSVTDVSKKLNFLSYGYDKQIEHLRKINEEYTTIENDIKVKGSATYNGKTYTDTGRGSKFREDFKAANAGSGLTFYPDKVKEQEQQYSQYINQKSATQQRIKGFAFQSMFGAPIAAETLSSSASSLGFANVAKGLETFSGGLTLASQMLSLFPNKLGSALATATLVSSFADSISMAAAKVGTYEKALDRQSTALEKMSSASNIVLDSYDKLSQLYNSGTSTLEDFITQQKRLSEALQDLASIPNGKGAALVQQITTAGSDEDRRTAVAKALDSQQEEKNIDAAKLEIAKAKATNLKTAFGYGNPFAYNRGLPGFNDPNNADSLNKKQLLQNAAITVGESAETAIGNRDLIGRLNTKSLTDRDISAIKNNAERTDVLGLGQGSEAMKSMLAELDYNLKQFQIPKGKDGQPEYSADAWKKHNDELIATAQAEIALRNNYNQELQNVLSKGAIVSNYLFKTATAGEESKSRYAQFALQQSGLGVKLAGLTTSESGMIGLEAQQKAKEVNERVRSEQSLNLIKGASGINDSVSKVLTDLFKGKIKDVQGVTPEPSPQQQAESAYLATRQAAFAQNPIDLINAAKNPEGFAEKFLGGSSAAAKSGINTVEYTNLSNSLSTLAKSPDFYAKIQEILQGTKDINEKGFLDLREIGAETVEKMTEARFGELSKLLGGLDILKRGDVREQKRRIAKDEYILAHSKNAVQRGEAAADELQTLPEYLRDSKSGRTKFLYDTAVTGTQAGLGQIFGGTQLGSLINQGNGTLLGAGADNSEIARDIIYGNIKSPNGPIIPNATGSPTIDTSVLQANVKTADDNLKAFGDSVKGVGDKLAALRDALNALELKKYSTPVDTGVKPVESPQPANGLFSSLISNHGGAALGFGAGILQYAIGGAIANKAGGLLKGSIGRVGQYGKNLYKEFREGKVAVPEVKIPESPLNAGQTAASTVTPMTEAEQQARELKLRKLATLASRPGTEDEGKLAKHMYERHSLNYEKQLEEEAKYSKDFAKNDYSHIINAPKKPIFSNAPFSQFKGDEATRLFNRIPQSKLTPTITKATSLAGRYASPLLRTLNPLMKYGGKALGVAGTLAGAYSAYSDFKEGDYWGAAGNAATTVAGFTGVGRAFNAGYYGGQAVGDAATWLGGHKNNALAAQYGQNAQDIFNTTDAHTGGKATSLAYLNSRIKSYQNSLNTYTVDKYSGSQPMNDDVIYKLQDQIRVLEQQRNTLYNSPNAQPKTESASPPEGPAPTDTDTQQSDDAFNTSVKTFSDSVAKLNNIKIQDGNLTIKLDGSSLTALITSTVKAAMAGQVNPSKVAQTA